MSEESLIQESGAYGTALENSEPAPERPEWLPEKFNTGEDLAKSYSELSSKLGAKEESIREQMMQEIQEKAFENRPASKGEYVLPDIIDEDSSVDNELLDWWSTHAFESGMSQEEFQEGIEMYAKAFGDGPDLEAEAERLGDNANQRIEAASLFANQFFPADALPAIERMCETADGIIALEAIMEATRDPSPTTETQPSSQITQQSLEEMMKDERYWNASKRDSHFVKQVDEGFKRLYG